MGVLLRVGLRGQARRLRAAASAVALGVMFLAATLLLSDTLTATMQRQAAGDIANNAAVVTPPEYVESPLDAKVVAAARRAPGVASVEAIRTTTVITGSHTPLSLATSPTQVHLLRGRAPAAPSEVAVTEAALASLAVDVGETVRVPETPTGAQTLAVVGVVEPGPETPLATSMPAGIATDETLGDLGASEYQEIRVTGASGVAPEDVRDGVAIAVGPHFTVLTGEEEADRRIQELTGGNDILTKVIIAFAAVALFTCMIVVSNTFTILLAQRQRQIALLRCVGAGRGQIVRSVLVEALVTGVVAAAAGVLLALGLGQVAVFAAQRFAPSMLDVEGLTILPAALLAPLVVGVMLTVCAALVPAVRGTRTSPLAALRPALPPVGRVRLARVMLGVLLVLAGVVLLAFGVLDGALMPGIAGGCVSFIGVFVLGPVVVPLLVGTVRRLVARLFGAPGALAVENARRNPHRAAATTSALLVGVTLIVMMTVGATIARTITDQELSGQLPVDALLDEAGEGRGFTPQDIATLTGVAGIAGAAQVTDLSVTRLVGPSGETEIDVVAVGPDAAGVARDEGLFDGLAPGVMLLDPGTAGQLQVADGDQVKAPWGAMTVHVGRVGGPVVLRSNVPSLPGHVSVWLRFADDADIGETIVALNQATAGMDGVFVNSPAADRAEIENGVEAVLKVAIALLAIAVVIALIGVGNTLGLSVIERTRESALLRAMGLTAGQLRGMLAIEAAVRATVAVVLGVALGIGYGWAGIATLFGDIPDNGVPLVIPWGRVALIAAVAVGAGILASVLPARRAARVAPAVALGMD